MRDIHPQEMEFGILRNSDSDSRKTRTHTCNEFGLIIGKARNEVRKPGLDQAKTRLKTRVSAWLFNK